MEKKNPIDELAEMVRERWNGSMEDEEVLYEQLTAFVKDRQSICDQEEAKDPERRMIERAAFSVLRVAIEERSTAVNMRREPQDYMKPAGGYASKEAVLIASNSIMSHVESCLDVADALLMEM